MSRKTFLILLTVALLAALLATPVFADKPDEKPKDKCNTIQSGLIVDSAGNPLTVGYDAFGYNYQAHMFNGTYDSSDRTLDDTYWDDTGDYVDDKLMMKWSDDWLANVDCDGDGKLDRGLVDGDVGGTSLGWLTNHVTGNYVGDDDNTHTFTEFIKIVWVGPGGDLWGQYTIIQDVLNDQYSGYNGVMIKVNPAGLGLY